MKREEQQGDTCAEKDNCQGGLGAACKVHRSGVSSEQGRVCKEVVILFTDMVQYSRLTQLMRPEEICDFISDYYLQLDTILGAEEFQPLILEPSAGDGAVIILEKRDGQGVAELCSRALAAALACRRAIDQGRIPATRMGLFLGDIIEAKLKNRLHRFGASFAVVSRIEELCGYYGTHILMDREMARNQLVYGDFIVAIGKITPKNFSSPYNLYSLILPGVGKYSSDMDREQLCRFITLKNEAIDLFTGHLLLGHKPNFPAARFKLREAQELHLKMVGKRDTACDRILEYIREYPFPESDFKYTGIKLGAKKGDAFGLRLFHLSKQLFRAIDQDLYNALITDTEWESFFHLEWREKGEVIVAVGDRADTIYYLDSGFAHAENKEGEIVAQFSDGSIFGEMAYYNKEKVRNATVIADSPVVLRKVSHDDFEKMDVVKKIFSRLAERRREKRESGEDVMREKL